MKYWQAKIDGRRARKTSFNHFDKMRVERALEVGFYSLESDLFASMKKVARVSGLPASMFSFKQVKAVYKTYKVNYGNIDPYKGSGNYKGD